MPKLMGVTRQELQNDDLTGRIIGAAFEVANELGHGFPETVYQNAPMLALRDHGLDAQPQVSLKVRFRNAIVGQFFADLVVENAVILELKSVELLLTEHQAQLINYLSATGYDIGLLINFGRPRLEYKRCRPRHRSSQTHEHPIEP